MAQIASALSRIPSWSQLHRHFIAKPSNSVRIPQEHVPKSGRFIIERYVDVDASTPWTISTGGNGEGPSAVNFAGVRIEDNGTCPALRSARTAVVKLRKRISNGCQLRRQTCVAQKRRCTRALARFSGSSSRSGEAGAVGADGRGTSTGGTRWVELHRWSAVEDFRPTPLNWKYDTWYFPTGWEQLVAFWLADFFG